MRFHSRLEINLSFLKHNFHALKNIAPHCEVLFMVKADAYGHGIVDVVKYAYEHLGVREFGVASLGEALHLRREIPEVLCDIFIFSDLEMLGSDNYRYYIDHRLIPVLTRFEELDFILEHDGLTGLPLCLKFNTGMNRLGFSVEDAKAIGNKLKHCKRDIHHLMTHIACAGQSMKSNKRNLLQKENFKRVKESFKSSAVKVHHSSIANSGMIEQGEGLEETHIRPGLAMYGASSLISQLRSKSLFKGKIIGSLKGEVINTFTVERGQPIGYGAKPVARAGVIAIISLGYGDGINQNYKGAKVTCGQWTGVVVGQVNMDMTYILFNEDDGIEKGMVVELWGDSAQRFHEFSDHLKISPYEIFCQITTRVPRLYHIN